MNNRSKIGNIGEDLACKHLLSKGFRIIDRNYRKPWGELDIITEDGMGVLVFVEVKTIKANVSRETALAINPEDNLTSAKLKKLQRTASLYAGYNEKLINDNLGWRIDLIAITIPVNVLHETSASSNLTNLLKHCEIKHFENI